MGQYSSRQKSGKKITERKQIQPDNITAENQTVHTEQKDHKPRQQIQIQENAKQEPFLQLKEKEIDLTEDQKLQNLKLHKVQVISSENVIQNQEQQEENVLETSQRQFKQEKQFQLENFNLPVEQTQNKSPFQKQNS